MEDALRRVEGVHWAEVNAVVGRVVVAFDGDAVGVGDLVEIVEAAEEAQKVHDERFSFDRPDHPGDREPARRALAGVVADMAGIGAGVLGAAVRLTPFPIELASLVTIVDSEPRLRRVADELLGPPLADITLASVNAVAQGLAQGPLGLLVDGVHRTGLFVEAATRRQAWERAEVHTRTQPVGRWGTPVGRQPRPTPLPPGPVESYTDRAALATLAGFGVALAATRDPRRAAAVILAGIPKGARLGREMFAAQLGRALAGRDVIVADHSVLRRLDRVDTVCLDAGVLFSGLVEVDRVELVGDADHVETQRQIRALLDPSAPGAARRRGEWEIGPLVALDVERPLALRRALRKLGGRQSGPEVLGLAHHARVVAVFTVVPELTAGSQALAEAARRAGHMIAIAGGDQSLLTRLGGHLLVDGGSSLCESVRDLQADGCAVVLVAGDHARALVAADCGIGVSVDGTPAWGGHVMVHGLEQAVFMIDATAVAYEVSRQSAALTLTGTAVGSLLAVSGAPAAARRAMTTVNLAALAAQANGARAAIVLSRQPRAQLRDPPPWHELDVDEVLDRLGSSRHGLSPQAASWRQGPVRRSLSAPLVFAQTITHELANPLTPLLAGGAALSAAVGSPIDAALIGAVTGLSALVGAGQRFRAARSVAALADRSAIPARVVHNGTIDLVPSDSLVPGSVFVVEAGSVVPGDARVIDAANLEVDEANLTGESFPVAKSPQPCFAPVMAERTSMLYEGTTIVAGDAMAVVVATGDDTQAAAGARWQERQQAPRGVDQRMARLSALTLPFAALGGAGVIGAGLLRGRPLSDSLGAGVSLAVAAVPEGLPVLATMAELAAARRLSARGALVRDPGALEALGRVEVLCIDKTGTLTQGRIHLHSIFDGHADADASALSDRHRRVLAAARRASPAPLGGQPLPHPTDQAVVEAARTWEADLVLGAPGWTATADLPFEPSRGYHASLGRAEAGLVLTVKGAPEVVLARCSTRLGRTGPRPVGATERRRLAGVVDRLARRGLRVLAVAERHVDADTVTVEDGLVDDLEFLGLLALADPVRSSASGALSSLRRAGVEVVMVTGDHPSTAEGIAAELGILNGRRIMTGAELEALDDDALRGVVDQVSVFARVAPADKVRIVTAYQRTGRAVAMTGDGANDAAAIRLADAGIALGAHSTPAARNAADVVITDDRVETIVDAIIEGRAMWGSVRDALAILLGGNLGEIAFTVGASALTGRTPLGVRQLLLVNLLTDVAPALAIAVRPPRSRDHQDLLDEGPDRSLGAPLQHAIVMRAVITAAGAGAAWSLASVTGGPKRAGTVALVALVGTQLGQTVTSGGAHPTVLAASVGSAALLAAIVQTPVVSQFFGCTPLGPLAWATAAGSAAGATAIGWAAPKALDILRSPSVGAPPSTPASGPSPAADDLIGEVPAIRVGHGGPVQLASTGTRATSWD